jgi:hypothetical protein
MSGAQEQPETPAIELKDEPNDSFMAGFEQDEDTREPTETPAVVEPVAAEPAPPEPKYVQITEDEWNATKSRAAKVDEISATFDKKLDTAFGKMGGMERLIKELQGGTPKGEAVQLDEADFAELAEEFPEVARLQKAGMNKMLARIKGTGADSAAIEKMVGDRVAEVRSEIVKSSLEVMFPNWEDEVKTPRFDAWLKSQEADVKALAESNKVGDAARMLRLYGKSIEPAATPAPKPPAAPAPAAPAQPSMRSRQIAAAVNLRGDSAAPPSTSGKSPFLSGFEDDD